jgi:hypothetical protein
VLRQNERQIKNYLQHNLYAMPCGTQRIAKTLAFICSKAQKSFPKSANGNRGAGRQSRRTDSTEKNFVFKDGFEKKRAAQRMNISSVKTAAHFD